MCGFVRASFSHQSSRTFSAKVCVVPSERLVRSDLNAFCTQKQSEEKSCVIAISYELISMQMHFLTSSRVIFSRKDVKMQLLSEVRSSTALTATSGLRKLYVV